jgi:hypothetical protein
MPVYSVNLLTSRVACDEVLAPAQRLQALLENQATNLSFDDTEADARAAVAQAELLGANAELSATLAILAALPAGTSTKRTRYEIKQAQLEARQRVLQSRAGAPATTLDRELDKARNAADLVVVQDFVAAVLAQKATLPN